MSIYYLCQAVTMASAFTSLGFSLAAFKKAPRTERVNVMYTLSRSIALAFASFIPIIYHSMQWLSAIAIIMIVVQGIDAVIGFKLKNTLKTYGPAITSLSNLAVLIWFLK